MPRKTAIGVVDVAVGIAVVAVAAYLLYRIRVGLHYRWEWSAIPQYLFRWEPDTGRWVPNLLASGLAATVRLSVWAIALAPVFGVLFGLLQTSGRLLHRLVARTYVELVRNLPPLVLIFLFYYFVSDAILPLLGIDEWARSSPEPVRRIIGVLFAPPSLFTAFASALITLSLVEGAYIAEIVRAGIQSVDRGQWEASRALGLSGWQQMRLVIGPQALRSILPPLAGQFISTIKDSAIVSVISIRELTFQAMELMASTYLTFEIWITVTLMYLLLTLPCSLIVRRIELRFHR